MNEALEDNPELVNSDPYGEGWIVKIKINASDTAELMDTRLISPWSKGSQDCFDRNLQNWARPLDCAHLPLS